MDALELRHWIYERLASTGSAPGRADIVAHAGGTATAEALLRELHDRHMLVLDPAGDVVMALPFAVRYSAHRVENDTGSWWANCAWDALAIPAALHADARIVATWLDTGDPVDLAVRDGEVIGDVDGFVHVAVPARHWWDDIVET